MSAIGYWEIGGPKGLQIYCLLRPSWFHRIAVSKAFGVRWHDGAWGENNWLLKEIPEDDQR